MVEVWPKTINVAQIFDVCIKQYLKVKSEVNMMLQDLG